MTALTELQDRLHELQRTWRQPRLVFHGAFGPDADVSRNVVHFLRHRDSPENYRYLTSRTAAISLQKELADLDVEGPDTVRKRDDLARSVEAWISHVDQAGIWQWQDMSFRLQKYEEAGVEWVDTCKLSPG